MKIEGVHKKKMKIKWLKMKKEKWEKKWWKLNVKVKRMNHSQSGCGSNETPKKEQS